MNNIINKTINNLSNILNIKLIIVIIIIVILIIYYYFLFKSVDKTENKKVDIIVDKDLFKFNKHLRKECKSKDTCYLSIHLVKYVTKMIKKYGLKNTIDYIRKNKNKFITEHKEYVFIHTKIKTDKNIINDKEYNYKIQYLYHHNKNLDKNDLVVSQENLRKNNICTVDQCDLHKIQHDITDFSDKYNKGFFEYKWFDPETNDIIYKRSYIEKLKGVNDTGIGIKDVYIGSGNTIETKIIKIDMISVVFYIINLLSFVILWYIFNIDNNINNKYVSNIIFFAILFIYIYNIYNHNISDENIEIIEEDYNTISSVSLSLSSLGLAMALFFSRVLNKNKKNVIKNCIIFLSISILFSILSFIDFTTKNTSINIGRKIELKNGLLLNSIAFLIITLVYIYFNNF